MTGKARRWSRLALGWLAALVLLAGCGGGVGTGGTGAAEPAQAQGPITGFGSVIVAGVTWNDDGAAVLDENGASVPRTGDELRLGMTVEIEGTDGAAPVARTIRLDAAVVGAVGSVDPSGRALSVLGQNVRIDPGTSFDEALPNGLASLRPGDLVAVHGLPESAGGGVLATRIDRADANATPRLRGTVADLDAAARTLRIGTLVLEYDGASGVPAALADGLVVRIAVRPPAGGGRWQVATFGRLDAAPEEGADVKVDGLVSGYQGVGDFVVGGLAVDASRADVRPVGGVLANGVRVEVRGTMSGGRLVAERVQVLGSRDIDERVYKLNGRIAAVNPTAGTFVLRKTVVDYRNAQFQGGTSADVAQGRVVRVEGPLSEDGSRILATSVEFR
jgi:hypothetical protein